MGIPLGSFRLYPTLDVRAGYDTNVFASSAGQQTGSAYEAIRPSLDVKSDWNNHMLNFGGYGAFGFFNSATSQNYQNFGFNTDGRLDIYRDWYLTLNAAFTGTAESLGTPDVAQTQSPSVVYAVPINLGMFQRFSRFYYQVNAGYTALRYSDASQLDTNALPAGSRDRNQFTERLRAGYELREGFDVWLEGGLNQRSYLQQVNIAGQQRDSSGWSVVAGSTLELSGVSKLEGFVGYTQQNYFNPGITTGAVTFGLGGTWNGFQPLVVRPFVIRSINETVFTNYQDYVSTTFGADFTYTLQSDWQLNAGATFSLLDYTPTPGTNAGAFAHTDDFYRVSIGALYSIRLEFQVGPLYDSRPATARIPTPVQATPVTSSRCGSGRQAVEPHLEGFRSRARITPATGYAASAFSAQAKASSSGSATMRNICRRLRRARAARRAAPARRRAGPPPCR